MQNDKRVTKYTEQMQQAIGDIESWASEELGVHYTQGQPENLTPIGRLEEALERLRTGSQSSYNEYVALNARNQVHGSVRPLSNVNLKADLPFAGVIHKTNIDALQGMNELYSEAKELERKLLEKRKERDD